MRKKMKTKTLSLLFGRRDEPQMQQKSTGGKNLEKTLHELGNFV
jgi:hypothetical protein